MKKTLVLVFLSVFFLSGCGLGDGDRDVVLDILSVEEAKGSAENFINENLLSPDNQAEIISVEEESGVFRLAVRVQNQIIDSYMTKDGKKFFAEGMDMDLEADEGSAAQAEPEPQGVEVSQKSEVPQVKLFVMALCPYSAQIERGLLPVLDILGDKVDFELKFCDYAMRAEEEMQEQLVQYCVQKEHSEKLLDYLDCFLDMPDSEKCLDQLGIDQESVNACVDRTDQEYDIMANLEDESSWEGSHPPFNIHKEENDRYGVSGSPTLVVNGENVRSPRDPNSLLETICSAFKEKPEECQEELSRTNPSAGFGVGAFVPKTPVSCG